MAVVSRNSPTDSVSKCFHSLYKAGLWDIVDIILYAKTSTGLILPHSELGPTRTTCDLCRLNKTWLIQRFLNPLNEKPRLSGTALLDILCNNLYFSIAEMSLRNIFAKKQKTTCSRMLQIIIYFNKLTVVLTASVSSVHLCVHVHLRPSH